MVFTKAKWLGNGNGKKRKRKQIVNYFLHTKENQKLRKTNSKWKNG